MNKLPKYWIVKNDGSQLFKDTVIKYLNKIFHDWAGSEETDYYGFDGNNSYNGTNNHCDIIYFKNNPTLLTLDEFIELSKENLNKYEIKVGDSIKIVSVSKVKEISDKGLTLQSFWDWEEVNTRLDKGNWVLIKNEEFILPEKWCIKDCKEVSNWASETFTCGKIVSPYYLCVSQSTFPRRGCYNFLPSKKDYTEITLEQFKKYVLKQTDMKKIKYYKILKKVWGLRGIKFSVGSKLDIRNKESLPYFESLGILNDTTIFEPVYEEEFKVGDVVYIKEAQQGAYGANNSFGIITDEEISAGIDELLSLRVNIKGSVWGIGDPNKCDIRLATEKEAEEYKNNLLLEEAKKRYPVGTKFISSYDNCTKDEIINGAFFWYGNNHIVANSINGCSVYINGKWAEILPSFPDITINGYKAKFSEDFVEFGCQKYSKKFVLKLNSCLQDNNFKMDYKDQIKQIAEYYNG